MALAPSTAAALKITPNPLLDRGERRSIAQVEAELVRLPHLGGDRRHVRQNRKAEYREAQQSRTAGEALGKIPEPDEAIHLVISGKFALWDFTSAILQMSGGSRIDQLVIATLGFSRRNITKMTELSDAGQIGNVRLLFSHYFRGTSGDLCEHMVEQFQARPERMEYLSVRTHCKLLLIGLSDGRRLTFESSANLRSCKNIEQVSVFGDPQLYQFHADWIGELFQAARATDASKKATA